MVVRFLLWLGAGVVTAGVSAAMVAGAGFAAADDGSAPGAGGGTSSETSNSAGSKEDSGKGARGGAQPSANDPEPSKDDDPDDATKSESPSTDTDDATIDEDATDEEKAPDDSRGSDSRDPKPGNHESLTATVKAKPADALDTSRAAVTEPDDTVVVEQQAAETGRAPAAVAVERTLVVVESAAADTDTPAVAAVAFAAPVAAPADATAAAPQIPGIIRVLGTIVFNLYSIATRLVGGPPVLPANSTVTVRSSTLRIDCGDGYEVPADWYIPAGAEDNPPQRLIYLQHGFLASGPWYSHTAAALAEQTGSIVVAPSITSNFLSCEACWLGAAPMHQAIANLFEADNTALAESALAAGWTGPIPDRVVLVGHSLGGGLVAGTSGYMVDNDTADRLAGVVMLDGVPLTDTATESLEKVPDEIPIYQLAAPRYFWNQFGVGSAALLEARPDRFVGVTLVGGSHVDAMRGGNPLIQFSQQLVSGFSTPQNVEAARILMVGWINDMFTATQDEGIYADPGVQITIDTPAGQATAVALPNSLTKPFPLNLLQPLTSLGNSFFTFEPTCVDESMGAAGSCSKRLAA
jgi:acetyl esterase/lipase